MSRLHITPAQKTAYRIGLAVALLALVAVMLPTHQDWLEPGPDNLGHEEIACVDCHPGAEGSTRQQIQANLQYLVGQRATPAWFSRRPTGNDQCLDCHENDSDRHPVDRFEETEFADARAAMAPQYCVSCHRQHQGRRVTMEYEACQLCHRDIEIPDDPIDVSHAQLARNDRWDTCFGCHDFHGNHDGEIPTQMALMHHRVAVEGYFESGPSPYGYRRLTVMQTMRVKK